MTTIFVHDPGEVQDYGVEWAAKWLRTPETVASHVITVTGATLVSSGLVGTQTVARVTGGTLGSKATIRHHVTASTGREGKLTQTLYIAQK